ncbi:MAG: hypothetical protein Q9M19_01405 [Mariprofundaceae bacterium]|nr:hypothetical protein [Mariprofundaceae bacterium]
MSQIWCIRKGEARGFMNELVACVVCDCRKRKVCAAYAEIALPELAKANLEAKRTGYQVSEDLPLFEAAQQQHE